MGLLDRFDRIIIINLPNRTDRRQEMRDDLERIGCDPDDPKIAWFPGIDPRTSAGFNTAGARGCFLSHVAALNLARNAGYGRALILEDDCQFAPDFLDREEEVAGWLDSTRWGLAYLGHDRPLPGPPGLQTWPPGQELLLAHCYAVTGEILPRLCPYLEAMPLRPPGSRDGGPMYPDGALNWFRRAHPDVTTVLVAPSMAHQRSSRSDLSPSWFDRLPVLSAAANRLRTIRRSLVRAN